MYGILICISGPFSFRHFHPILDSRRDYQVAATFLRSDLYTEREVQSIDKDETEMGTTTARSINMWPKRFATHCPERQAAAVRACDKPSDVSDDDE